MRLDDDEMYVRSLVNNCRYNSRGVVYCESYLHYLSNDYKLECVYDYYGHSGLTYLCGEERVPYNTISHYRLRMGLNIRDLSKKCKDSFKSTSHFKDVKLVYTTRNGKTFESDLLSDQIYSVSYGYLPSSFDALKKYYFKFTTKNDCIFYGDFNTISSTFIDGKFI